MGKKNFYAVKIGNGGPAIYKTWAECEAQVKGFQGAVFKGFATHPEAEAFIGGSYQGGSASAAAPVAKRSKISDGRSAPAAAASSSAWVVAASSSAAPAASSSAKPNAFSALMSAGGGGKRPGGVRAGEIAVFTDGACAGNQNVAVTNNPAGWGACVVEGCSGEPPVGGVAVAELYGPVDLDATSPHYLGAEVKSNNTGELSAVCEALRWLIEHEPSSRPAWICYDSKYAMNQATGTHKAHTNVALARRSHQLLAEARKKRKVDFLHVKGHSGHEWNDVADSLANRGATGARSTAGGFLQGGPTDPAPAAGWSAPSNALRKRAFDDG